MEDIKLDIGCGNSKADGFIGIDYRKLDCVDIVHDLEVLPYPIESESCSSLRAAHIVEHLKPWLIFGIMNEWWRILKPSCCLYIQTPLAGTKSFNMDPSHIKGWSAETPQYFDVRAFLYSVYTPKPWIILNFLIDGDLLHVTLKKLTEEEGIRISNEEKQ